MEVTDAANSISSLPTSAIAIAVFDIDGVVRDVGGSYRRAIADTVEHFTEGAFRPTMADIDRLKSEGIWNNDWEASCELTYRYWESQGRSRHTHPVQMEALVAFFQARYRGAEPGTWTGYICQEPLLIATEYLQSLLAAGIPWGFFSGAMRDEALYVLEGGLKIQNPVLVAMEDAPGKPDPTGLFDAVRQLEQRYALGGASLAEQPRLPVLYAGDTVADLYTVREAARQQPSRSWIGIGILPPHVRDDAQKREAYAANLQKAGAVRVFASLEALTPEAIAELLSIYPLESR